VKLTIDAVCGAKAVALRGDEKSAIGKQVLKGKVRVTKLGLEGDEQADLAHHGGPDMAVHLYPLDHHAFWREELGDHPLLDTPGAFGSNLSVAGIAERDVCLGDRFRLGTALVEACQPRKPCWKIEHRFERKKMVKRILQTNRCGWYYRVLEEGELEASDTLELVEQGLAEWSMERIFSAVWGTSQPRNMDNVRAIFDLVPLADRMRAKLGEMLDI